MYQAWAIHKIKFTISIVLTEASPSLGLLALRGKRINLDLYSFSLCTFCCRASTFLFLRLWSTDMPTVRAYFRLTPACCSRRSNNSVIQYRHNGDIVPNRLIVTSKLPITNSDIEYQPQDSHVYCVKSR